MTDPLRPFVQINTRSQDLNRVQDHVGRVVSQLTINPWVNGEIGTVYVEPSDLDTGDLTAIVTGTTYNLQIMLVPVTGLYMYTATVQYRTGDNSTATTGSHDFTVSAEGPSSMVGALCNVACIDYGSVYLDTVSGSTSGEISQATIVFPMYTLARTALYLNVQSQFTGSALRARGALVAARIA